MAVLSGTAAFVCAGELEARRAAKRAALTAPPVQQGFGLLVIPVDFEGDRLPRDWNAADALSDRLGGAGPGSLRHYFRIASGGRLDLRLVLSPRVGLAGTPADYSDLGLNGFTRTRALATEALEGAAAAGVEFERADVATADGDLGWVDGVLILHAAPGVENDPVNGRVVPLQFFLEEPVRSGAASADSYAVASLHSGLGIWAHETAHLLGLEDRYDLRLSSGGDSAVSRGGLGAFSLMAAGAWGPDLDGAAPALLDAYSAIQLGWQTAIPPGTSGASPLSLFRGQPWRHDVADGEYFLIEARWGEPAAPYDAVFPEQRIVVYHVDESVPDDAAGGDPVHLRVRLVEADGDADLASGLTAGEADDVFGTAFWGPDTTPDTDGYLGASGLVCDFRPDTEIAQVDVHYPARAPVHVLSLGDSLELRVEESLQSFASLRAVVRIVGPEPRWGEFSPGGDEVVLEMRREGRTWHAVDPPAWSADAPATPAGASTRFEVEFTADGVTYPPADDAWLWGEVGAALAVPASWPGAWTPDTDGQTIWFLRPGGEPNLPEAPLLACSVDDGAVWPDTRYANGDDAVLTSAPLVNDGRLLRITHHVDLHAWEHAEGWDGAVVEALLPDGSVVPLTPIHGYDGRVGSEAATGLAGRPAFTGPGDLDALDRPVFRADLFDLGAVSAASLQLRLRLVSDGAWRGRGWLVAALDDVAGDRHDGVTRIDVDGGLRFHWSGETPALTIVEWSTDGGVEWYAVWDGEPTAEAPGVWTVARPLLNLPADPPAGSQVRVRLRLDRGETLLRSALLAAPATTGAALSLCEPNPAPGYGRFDVSIPAGPADLSLFDPRGRRLRDWRLPPGDYRLEWDGRDGEGRRLPSGTYLFRLETAGAPPVFRKVVLIR